MPHVDVREFVVMPNHVHGIIVIKDRVAVDGRGRGGEFAAPTTDPVEPPPPDGTGAGNFRPRPIAMMVKNALGHIMQTFKAAVSRQAIRDGLMPRGIPVWQRGYYEHIIRDDGEHDRLRLHRR